MLRFTDSELEILERMEQLTACRALIALALFRRCPA